MDLKSTPFLEIPIHQPQIIREDGAHGQIYLKSTSVLTPYPSRITDRLVQWAHEIPDHTFIGQRDSSDHWKRLSYKVAYEKTQALGQYFISKKVSKERPVVILSGNSIEMAIVKLACMHIGIPFAPVSESYSTKSADFEKLRYCINLLTPGLIFVQNGEAFKNSLSAVGGDVPVLAVKNPLPSHDVFDDAVNTSVTEAVHDAYSNVTFDTVAKILFTSGSTGLPKGVMNTHGNITTNAQQTVQVFPFMMSGGFHIIDWLPWNHTFGGNNNFGMALYTGGSLHIDDGSPSPEGIKKTVRNLREIAPTIYYNVPKGFEELVPNLKADKDLCRFFFSRLKMFFYAGASMPQRLWDDLELLALDTTGKRLFIGTGLGMTEASPSCMFNIKFNSAPGKLGIPVSELTVKLVPDEDKLEARFKGKNLTPGYWRNIKATEDAFDEEGFYKTGDAVKIIDQDDLSKGLIFDGRLAENFKLQSGTWVSVGSLKANLIAAGEGMIQDAVITGHDQEYIGAIIFPDVNFCLRFLDMPHATLSSILHHEKVKEEVKRILNRLASKSTGSSTMIKKAILADFELSIDKGEITDKGTINQRAVIRNRSDYVQKLYMQNILPEIIEVLDKKE